MLNRTKPTLIQGSYRNWESLAAYRQDADRARQQLRLIHKSENAAGIRLFSVMRNEYDLLPNFLEHYRNLGVAKFVIVDNDSTDGSRELLLQQTDVDLYHAAGSYAGANGGTLWLDSLMYEQARGEWVLNVDADELLVYDQCDKYPLTRLVDHLRAIGDARLLAPMVDLYRHPDRSPDVFFDAVPEYHRKSDRGSHIEGGPRYRMAVLHNHDARPCLTKYPLALYGTRTAYANNHFPYPTKANGDRIFGRLLHLKLTSHFKIKVEQALRERQHWNDCIEYQGYAKWLGSSYIVDLMIERSTRYASPADLIAAGLLQAIDWQKSNSGFRVGRTLRRVLRVRI